MAYIDRFGNQRNDLWETVQEQYFGIQPESLQPTQPEGFFYPEPTGQGISYPADQPVEPLPQRTVESVPDYYGNTIPIEAVGEGGGGLQPEMGPPTDLQEYIRGGGRSFTNLPGQGDDAFLMEEAPVEAPVPGGLLPSTYDVEGVETPQDYIRARGVQEREAEGLYNDEAVRQALLIKHGPPKGKSVAERKYNKALKDEARDDAADALMIRAQVAGIPMGQDPVTGEPSLTATGLSEEDYFRLDDMARGLGMTLAVRKNTNRSGGFLGIGAEDVNTYDLFGIDRWGKPSQRAAERVALGRSGETRGTKPPPVKPSVKDMVDSLLVPSHGGEPEGIEREIFSRGSYTKAPSARSRELATEEVKELADKMGFNIDNAKNYGLFIKALYDTYLLNPQNALIDLGKKGIQYGLESQAGARQQLPAYR